MGCSILPLRLGGIFIYGGSFHCRLLWKWRNEVFGQSRTVITRDQIFKTSAFPFLRRHSFWFGPCCCRATHGPKDRGSGVHDFQAMNSNCWQLDCQSGKAPDFQGKIPLGVTYVWPKAWVQIAASSSRNAVSFSAGRTTKCFPLSRYGSFWSCWKVFDATRQTTPLGIATSTSCFIAGNVIN